MIELTSEPVNFDAILAAAEDNSAGGVAIFLGRVRDHAEDRKVLSMEYEAYPEMAISKMRAIADEAKSQWPIAKLVIVHRTGHLQVGEVSVAIAVACVHRGQAFEACRFIIDTLKKSVPIWKKEYFADGEGWVKGTIPKKETI